MNGRKEPDPEPVDPKEPTEEVTSVETVWESDGRSVYVTETTHGPVWDKVSEEWVRYNVCAWTVANSGSKRPEVVFSTEPTHPGHEASRYAEIEAESFAKGYAAAIGDNNE
jgi:hypothetical protein